MTPQRTRPDDTRRTSLESCRQRLVQPLEQRLLLAASPLDNDNTHVDGVITPAGAEPHSWSYAATTALSDDGLLDDVQLTNQLPRQIVFVDRGIGNYQALIDDIDLIGDSAAAGFEIVLLDANHDGVSQITDYLSGARQVSGIHVISHGSSGSLQLGSARLDGASLDNYAEQLGRWSESLTDGADILLYGCKLAGGAWGVSFVDDLSALTGADVAASTDLTGAERLGGDWALEHATGVIDTNPLFGSAGVAGFDDVLVKTIQADDVASTFTIMAASVSVVGGNPPDTYQFETNKDTPVALIGSQHNDTFNFSATPDLNLGALSQSTLDGGAGTNTVDFSQRGDKNTKLKLTINDLDGANSEGIAVADINAVVFTTIRRVDTINGGVGENTFEFHDTWDRNLTVNGSTVAGTSAAALKGTLDFTNIARNVTSQLTNAGGVVVTVPDVNDNLRTVTAEHIKKVSIASAQMMTLDLSLVNQDITIRVEANKVTVNTALVGDIEFEHVDAIILGPMANAIQFVGGASIGSLARSAAGTQVFLDYSDYGQAATVNASNQAINLNSTNAAGTLQIDQAINNNPVWGTATWRLSDLDVNSEVRFTYGGATSDAVQLGTGGLVNNFIEDALEDMAGIRSAAVATVVNGLSWDITITTDTAGDPGPLGATNGAAAFEMVGATDWLLAVAASSGTFTIATTQTTSDPIDVVAARVDPRIIVNALNNLLNGDNAMATVIGAGTDENPWRITWTDNTVVFTADPFQTAGLSDDATVKLEKRASMAADLSQWEAHNPGGGGAFKFVYNNGARDFNTVELPYNAPAELVKLALENVKDDLIVNVTGDGTQNVPWEIEIGDPALADLALIGLTVERVGRLVPALSASAINDATDITGGNQLLIDGIIGTGNQNDQFFGNGNDPLQISTKNGLLIGGFNVAIGSDGGGAIVGGGARDLLSGGGGADTIDGRSGSGVLLGQGGADRVEGGSRADWIFGGAGNDIDNDVNHVQIVDKTQGLFGDRSKDVIFGGAGNDELDGGHDEDELYGGADNDVIKGAEDDDMLFGDTGDDELFGGSGKDTLDGGDTSAGALSDTDTLAGGQHDDIYVFRDRWGTDRVQEAANQGTDTLDFTATTVDVTVSIRAMDNSMTSKLEITDGNGNRVRGVQSATNANPGYVENVEHVLGGHGTNVYSVEADWTGTISVNDSVNGRTGVVDLSNLTGTVTITIKKIQQPDGSMQDGFVVRRTDGVNATLTATGVAYIRVGQSVNTVVVATGASIAGTLLPPTINAGAHSIILDYSGYDDAIVNLGGTINFNDNTDLVDAGNSFLQQAGTNVPARPATSTWSIVVEDKSAAFTLTFGDRGTGTALSEKTPLTGIH